MWSSTTQPSASEIPKYDAVAFEAYCNRRYRYPAGVAQDPKAYLSHRHSMRSASWMASSTSPEARSASTARYVCPRRFSRERTLAVGGQVAMVVVRY